MVYSPESSGVHAWYLLFDIHTLMYLDQHLMTTHHVGFPCMQKMIGI